MQTIFHDCAKITFTDHPRFANVKLAVLVSQTDTDAVSVSQLLIAPATEIPIHTHEPQTDSIFVMAGSGQAYVNGEWRPIAPGDYIFVPATVEHGIRNTGPTTLKLFIHHSPPLL